MGSPRPPGTACIPVHLEIQCAAAVHEQVTSSGFTYANQPWFAQALQLLAHSGAYGVAVDVWVGAPGPAYLLINVQHRILMEPSKHNAFP